MGTETEHAGEWILWFNENNPGSVYYTTRDEMARCHSEGESPYQLKRVWPMNGDDVEVYGDDAGLPFTLKVRDPSGGYMLMVIPSQEFGNTLITASQEAPAEVMAFVLTRANREAASNEVVATYLQFLDRWLESKVPWNGV